MARKNRKVGSSVGKIKFESLSTGEKVSIKETISEIYFSETELKSKATQESVANYIASVTGSRTIEGDIRIPLVFSIVFCCKKKLI